MVCDLQEKQLKGHMPAFLHAQQQQQQQQTPLPHSEGPAAHRQLGSSRKWLMGLASKCWKEQDDHQCPYYGPEERALDKLPTQTEQSNTGSPGPWGLQAPVCRPAGMRGLDLLSPSLQRPRVPVETPPGIRAEMHIWDTPEAGMMVTCPSLVGTGL